MPDNAKDTPTSAETWCVRFELATGGFTFTDITHGAGTQCARSEAEAWAAVEIARSNGRLARVARIYSVSR